MVNKYCFVSSHLLKKEKNHTIMTVQLQAHPGTNDCQTVSPTVLQIWQTAAEIRRITGGHRPVLPPNYWWSTEADKTPKSQPTKLQRD